MPVWKTGTTTQTAETAETRGWNNKKKTLQMGSLETNGMDTKEKVKLHTKARDLYRQNGWELLREERISGIVPSTLLFYGKAPRGTSIAQLWDDGGVTTYFEGGGATWEDLEKELAKT